MTAPRSPAPRSVPVGGEVGYGPGRVRAHGAARLPGNQTPAAAGRPRCGPLMAYLAALVVLAGVPIHLYWALGGTWGATRWRVNRRPARTAPDQRDRLGSAGGRGGRGVRAHQALGAAATGPGHTGTDLARLGGVHLTRPVRDGHTKGLYAAGAHSAVSFPEPLTAGQKNHAALLDLGVFEPWFLVQGLLLLFADRWFARTAGGHRRWTLSLIVGTALVDVFGVALAVAHQRFAVS